MTRAEDDPIIRQILVELRGTVNVSMEHIVNMKKLDEISRELEHLLATVRYTEKKLLDRASKEEVDALFDRIEAEKEINDRTTGTDE